MVNAETHAMSFMKRHMNFYWYLSLQILIFVCVYEVEEAEKKWKINRNRYAFLSRIVVSFSFQLVNSALRKLRYIDFATNHKLCCDLISQATISSCANDAFEERIYCLLTYFPANAAKCFYFCKQFCSFFHFINFCSRFRGLRHYPSVK